MNVMRSIPARRYRLIISLLLSSLFFVVLVFVSYLSLPGASRLSLTLELDHQDRMQLYYWNGLRTVRFQEQYSVRSEEIAPGTRTPVKFVLKNVPVNRVRLDLGESGGTVRLYQMVVTSHFTKPVVFPPPDIYRLFEAGRPGMDIRLQQGYVEVVSRGDDPYLVSTAPLNRNLPLVFGLPLIASGLFFLVVQRFEVSAFPAIRDIKRKKPSTGTNINALDGLRAVAIMMVVADHSWGLFRGLGTGGVWIFMALSGFLLARPFIVRPERVVSAGYMSHFFLRRLQRILPVYYLYIIVIYILTFRFDAAFKHFLFLQGDGHLWVVPQEMFFYLLVPFIMGLNFFLFRKNPWLIAAGLTLLMVLANRYVDRSVIALLGKGYQESRPFIGIFLAGIIASYLYYGIYEPWYEKYLFKYSAVLKPLFACITVLLLLLFLLWSTKRPWGGQRILASEYFPWYGIAAGALIFSIIGAGQTWIDRILSNGILRAISLVSFSLYIFHPLVIRFLRKGILYYSGYFMTGMPLFVISLVASYVVASVTYTYIERPFLE